MVRWYGGDDGVVAAAVVDVVIVSAPRYDSTTSTLTLISVVMVMVMVMVILLDQSL